MELFIPVLQALKLMRASHFLVRCVCVLFVLIRHSSSGWTAMYVCMWHHWVIEKKNPVLWKIHASSDNLESSEPDPVSARPLPPTKRFCRQQKIQSKSSQNLESCPLAGSFGVPDVEFWSSLGFDCCPFGTESFVVGRATTSWSLDFGVGILVVWAMTSWSLGFGCGSLFGRAMTVWSSVDVIDCGSLGRSLVRGILYCSWLFLDLDSWRRSQTASLVMALRNSGSRSFLTASRTRKRTSLRMSREIPWRILRRMMSWGW